MCDISWGEGVGCCKKCRSDINETVVRQTETINALYAFIGAVSWRVGWGAGWFEEELVQNIRTEKLLLFLVSK